MCSKRSARILKLLDLPDLDSKMVSINTKLEPERRLELRRAIVYEAGSKIPT
jgi:hypothetical protein